MVTVDRLSRFTPIDGPQALRQFEEQCEIILGRTRCTDQSRAMLYVISHRQSRPQPPREALLAFWRRVAAELPAVKHATVAEAGLLLVAEVSGSVESARLRHRLSVALAGAATPQAPWRGSVDALTMDPWRPAFETLAPFAQPARPRPAAPVEDTVALTVLAAQAAPRLRDFARRFVARTRSAEVAANASLAVEAMVDHLVQESRPAWVRLDIRNTASTTGIGVHARCGEPAQTVAPSPMCCSSQLMRGPVRSAGESRTPTRHRLWCEV